MNGAAQYWLRIVVVATLLVAGVSHAASLREQLDAIARKGTDNLEIIDFIVKRYKGGQIPLDAEGAGDCAAATCMAYRKVEIGDEVTSEREAVLLQMSRSEVEVMAGLAVGAAGMRAYGFAAMLAQNTLNNAVAGAAGARMPLGLNMLLGTMNSSRAQQDSLQFINPLSMFGSSSGFAFAAADMIDNTRDQIMAGAAQAQMEARKRADMAANAVAAQAEAIAGRMGQRYDINDINETVRTEGGDEFVMRNAKIWIDIDNLLLLKHRVEGTADNGQDFFIETINSDFRGVPGTELCEPYQTTMRMGGMMDEAQLAELAEAREQLAEMEAQLAAMPANQRQMMENMMGSQMDMLRNMTDDGVLENTQIVEEIYVNPDLSELFRVNPEGASGMTMAAAPGEENLVERIQRDLGVLGYDPGDATGELTTETAIAISQYQAANGLTVTGEASEALAAAISVEAGQMAEQLAAERQAERARAAAAATDTGACG